MTNNERTWRPKMGDKVMITGLIDKDGHTGVIVQAPPTLLPDWYWVKTPMVHNAVIHVRNLDPVYEDERKAGSPGLGRMMKVGDEVMKHTSTPSRITRIQPNGVISSSPLAGAVQDVYYILIERRRKDEGRKARKVDVSR